MISAESVVARRFGCAVGDVSVVKCERAADAGDFPNAGIWRCSGLVGDQPWSLVCKSLHVDHRGTSPVWGAAAEPDNAFWWAREASFYRSDLLDGWPDDARPATPWAVTDRTDGGFDIWLEDVTIPAIDIGVYRRAVGAIAGWQLNHYAASNEFLSRDWIATQVARRTPIDNTETLHNPQWTVAFDRGLSPAVRAAVTARITEPGKIRDRLHRGPQCLTHYDFHHGNIGRVGDDDVAIIDWAYVGWGPAGHDVGHLVIDTWDHLPDFGTPVEAWDDLTGTYIAALREHGWNGDPAEVLAGIGASTAIRYDWVFDELLAHVLMLPDAQWAVHRPTIEFIADLTERYLR